jgi:hypothetical protein
MRFRIRRFVKHSQVAVLASADFFFFDLCLFIHSLFGSEFLSLP